VPLVSQDIDSGPGPRLDSDSGIVRERAISEVSGVVSEPVEGLDPPPPPRPVHPPEEDTPPATDIDELARMRERKV
jgi:hypothetical protein